MFCSKCGTEAQSGDRSCRSCGAPLASQEGQPDPAPEGKGRKAGAQAARGKGFKAAVVPLLGVVLVFGVIGVALAQGWLKLPFISDSDSGSSLRVIPGQTISANIDSSGYTNFNAQTVLADGGSPLRNYEWSLDLASNPPSGIAIGPLTGVISRAGTSSVGLSVGTTSFRVKVSDGNVTRTGTVTLQVTGATPGMEAVLQQLPVDFQLKDGEANKAYGASLFVMGGTPPYSWRLDASYAGSADLTMAGLTVDGVSGMVRGTIVNSAAGRTIRFRVLVTDNAGDTAVYSPVYTIKVD